MIVRALSPISDLSTVRFRNSCLLCGGIGGCASPQHQADTHSILLYESTHTPSLHAPSLVAARRVLEIKQALESRFNVKISVASEFPILKNSLMCR